MMTEGFKVKVELHHGSVSNPFLFVVMDRLTVEIMFTDGMWWEPARRRGRAGGIELCRREKGNESNQEQGERNDMAQVTKGNEFTYLGSTVQSYGECAIEVKKRVLARLSDWRRVTGVLCDRRVSARIKEKIYKTAVRPAMLYDLETVIMTKR